MLVFIPAVPQLIPEASFKFTSIVRCIHIKKCKTLQTNLTWPIDSVSDRKAEEREETVSRKKEEEKKKHFLLSRQNKVPNKFSIPKIQDL